MAEIVAGTFWACPLCDGTLGKPFSELSRSELAAQNREFIRIAMGVPPVLLADDERLFDDHTDRLVDELLAATKAAAQSSQREEK